MNRPRLPPQDASAWIALLGVWAGLAAAGVYFNSVDTRLQHFTGRVIGHAVMFGLDPALRIRAYVIICAVALSAAGLVIIALYHLQARAAARAHVLLSRSEQRTACLLALIGISDLTLHVLTAAPAYLDAAEFLLLATALLAAAPILRLLAGRFDTLWPLHLGSPMTQGAILLLAYQLSVGLGILMEWPLTIGAAALGRFVVIWLLLQATAGLLTAHRDSAAMKAGRRDLRLLHASLPLLWLPAVAPLANELQYTLRAHTVWTPLTLARVMALGLVAGAVGLWFRPPAASWPARTALRRLHRCYLPVVLVTNALLTLHRQTMTIDAVDVYHHGELTTPVSQILQHGRIPYLEMCLPHGLMDIVPQILFGALNGGDRWDILIWGSGHWPGWLTLTAGLLLLYALLMTVASPLAAVLVLLFLPAEILFPLQYAPLIICVLALRAFVKSGGARRAWMLPASVLAVFLWRIDFGLAALVAAGAALVIVAWSCRRMRWGPLLAASGAILAGTAGLTAALAALRDVSLRDVTHNFLAYIAMQIPVASYFDLYDKMSPLVVVQYLLLPAVGLLIVLYCGVRAVLLRQCAAARVYGLLWLAVASLVLFVRALQRHSLFEGVFSPHLFLFLLAAIPALLQPSRRALVSGLLVVVTVSAALALPETRLFPHDVKWPAIIGGPAGFTFRTWTAADQRVLVPDPPTDDVVRLLHTQLKPGQTFYDFSNAPLLYFLTGAAPPTYIIETTFHASDDLQRATLRDLEALRRDERLPFVVFKQHTGFDAVDGIPNEIRSYRIAEYLYAHYTPWVNAGRFEIWIDRRLAPQAPVLETGLEASLVARYPLVLHAPAATANLSIQTTPAGGLTLTSSGDPAWAEGLFVPPEQVVWAPGLEYYLHIRYATSAQGILQAVFSFAGSVGSTRSSTEVIAGPAAEDRPGDLYLPLRLAPEAPPALTGIRLVLPRAATVTIIAAELEVRRRPPGAPPAWGWSPVLELSQQFDLFRLPHVWASFDDHDPVHTAAELQTLQPGDPIDLEPGREEVFAVRPAAMESGQYLHLRLQAGRPAVVTVAYGDATPPNTFTMLVDAAAEPQDYLIRMSTQRDWYRGATTTIRLSSSAPVRLYTLRLLAGD